MKRLRTCLACLLFLTGSITMVHAEAYRGDLNSWQTNWMSQDTNFGSVWNVTLSCTASDGTSDFKFDRYGDWSGEQWGFPAGATKAGKNSTIGDARYDGGSPANLTFDGATNGFRYTFRMDGVSTDWFRDYVVMETSGDPTTIAVVSDNHAAQSTNDVTVTIQLSSSKHTQEEVWIRYTTNGWSSDQLAARATGSTTNYQATLPAQPGGVTVEYYILSSTLPSNQIASNPDLCTLKGKKAGATNFTYTVEDNSSAAWVWHADNRVTIGTNVQCWVKIGYAQGTGTNRWVEYATIYYTTNGSDPAGAYGDPTNSSTFTATMSFDHMEGDSYPTADAMWWAGTLTNLPSYTTIKYRIGAWKTTNNVERFADYNTSGTNNNVFSFSLGTLGDPELTVNGVNGNYTTTKFFIDEAEGDTEQVVVFFTPGVSNSTIDKIEIFSNLDRRDYVTVDYTNANIVADGYHDGINPPEGNYITTNDTGAYFTAYPMIHIGAGVYVWTGTVSKCGAYRLTARYTTNGMAANTWNWYSDYAAGRRDHAVVASPKKVLEMTMYELNTLTVEATFNDKDHRSTFVDLLSAADGDGDGFDPFNLDYLGSLGINCLWFQPIHPNAVTDRGNPDGFVPGSPYATLDYFAVSKYFGSNETTVGAMDEFTNFVAKCDAYSDGVGTINIMLDGVFNHTAWDAEMGAGGVDLGFTSNPTNRIGAVRPEWYALWTDYGTNASFYNTVDDNDFATAPDRGDFGKWDDVTELFFGNYSALVRHNPDNNADYLNEDDVFDYTTMTNSLMDMWTYFGYYPKFWLLKTGHAGTNAYDTTDDQGIDGLRCDFGQGLPPQCWEYIINRTRTIKWNFIFMAETLDGGKPGYRSNRHFDVLNENIVFKFTQAHINDSWDVREAIEERRTAYSGGAILLNLTSHDEVLPDDDPWLVASRYGAVSSMDGIPMIFYGQEHGIRNYDAVAWTNDGFRTDHEENFGKYIPNFKQWNELLVWSNPPPLAVGITNWYSFVNRARHASPALRSQNRYFLSPVSDPGDTNDARIFAVAKYEHAYGSPATSDVVLAFALLFRHGEAHAAATNTYNLQSAWSLLGLDVSKLYSVRNLASSAPDLLLTDGWPQSGQDLYDNGIYVVLNGGEAGNLITNDGELVQYLKIEEVNRPPVLTVPGPHTLPVGSPTNFDVTATDPDGDDVEINNLEAPANSYFDGTIFTWTATVASCDSSNTVAFEADDGRGETNSIVTNATYILVPYDSDADSMSDGWEWSSFTTLVKTATGDEDGDGSDNRTELIAGTDPNLTSSVFYVENIVDSSGQTNFEITITTESNKHYALEFTDKMLSNGVPWSGFANTNDGVGTWLETRGSTNYAFTDDYTTNTTDGEPADGFRAYRFKVENP